VPELHGRRRAFGMDRVAEAGQARQRLGPHPDLVAEGASVGRHRAVGQGGRSDTPGRKATVPVDELPGHQPVAAAGFVGGRLDDAVAEFDRAETKGAEERWHLHDGGG
jgi:hypothetical protein